jgi:hypothetical protein
VLLSRREHDEVETAWGGWQQGERGFGVGCLSQNDEGGSKQKEAERGLGIEESRSIEEE